MKYFLFVDSFLLPLRLEKKNNLIDKNSNFNAIDSMKPENRNIFLSVMQTKFPDALFNPRA